MDKFKRIITAIGPCMLLVLGLFAGDHGDRAAAGPIANRRAEMPANVPKTPTVQQPGQPGQPVMQPRLITVPLEDLPDLTDETVPLDTFCHRPRERLGEAYVGTVSESLKQEKQLDPIQIFKDENGIWQYVTGHRRAAAMFLNAKKGVAGFSLKMPVMALDLTGKSHQERLILSVTDNEVREKLEPKDRLLIGQKFSRAGVPKERGAAALAISVKSYERDLRVATQPIMLEHVLQDHISPGAASRLIQAAEKNNRAQEFYSYFGEWVEAKEMAIQELDRLTKAETDKGLKNNELLVMNYLSQQVLDGWLEALGRGTPLTDKTAFNFAATLDKKTGKLRVERLNVDTQEATVLDLVKLGSKLSQLGKRVLVMADRKRKLEQLDAPMGPQAALATNPSPYDTDVLAEFNLLDLAPQLETEGKAEETAAEEPAEEETEEPTEGVE